MRAGGLLLALLAVGALLSLAALPGLRFEHGPRSLLRRDAAAEREERTLRGPFGSDDLILVAWETEDATAPAALRRIREVTDAIAAIPGLEEVYSIANVPLLPALRPLSDEDVATAEGRARARAALLDAPVYLGTIYNEALDVVAVAGTLRDAPRADRERAIRELRAVASGFGADLRVAGVTALAVEAGEYAVRDLVRVGGLALAVSLAVLFVVTGSLREMIVALAATALPPLYALGIAAALDIPVTALSAALFPILAVVGVTSAVHLLNAFAEERGHGRAVAAAARLARRRVAAPIALSLATTAVAFLSLQATGVPAFHAAGSLVAAGLAIAIPVLLLGVPAALVLARPRRRAPAARRLDRPLLALGRGIGRHPRAVTGVVAAFTLAGVALATQARVSVDVLQAFRPDTGIARTYDFLERRLTPTLYVDAVLEASPDAGIGEILADLERFSDRAVAIPGVENAISLVSLVRYGQRIVPLESAALAILRSGNFERITAKFEDREGRRYRVKVRIREATPPEVLDRLAVLAADFRTGTGRLTGLYPRAVDTTRSLVRSLGLGTLLMTLFVVLTVGLALRSWRLGVAALLPNLLPPAMVFGGAAALGVPLDVSAVAVAVVAIGLAVDDSLHVVFRVAGETRSGRPLGRALLRTQRSVGRALVLSTVVLVAGLLCLQWSSFLPTVRFGRLTAIASAVALVGDLVLLPAVLKLFRRV